MLFLLKLDRCDFVSKGFVSESDLNTLKHNWELEVKNLRDLVKKYCNEASEIDAVITSLLKYYSTEGGRYKVREIGNIDLLGDSFKNLIAWADSINVNITKSSLIKYEK